MIVCGACAFLVYLILEPFIHSILWAILTGALLFPLKHRLTSLTLRYLQQLDTNSHLVSYGLVILLPWRIFDQAIESIGPICIQNYKPLLFTSIFLPSIEFLQSDIVYEWITTIGYDYLILFQKFIYLFDSLWVIILFTIYLCAVFVLYNNSLILQYVLKTLALPIWCCLFIYLSQFFPVNYRLLVITFSAFLICCGYLIDQKINRKLRF